MLQVSYKQNAQIPIQKMKQFVLSWGNAIQLSFQEFYCTSADLLKNSSSEIKLTQSLFWLVGLLKNRTVLPMSFNKLRSDTNIEIMHFLWENRRHHQVASILFIKVLF